MSTHQLSMTLSVLPPWVTLRVGDQVIHQHLRRGVMVPVRRCARHGVTG